MSGPHDSPPHRGDGRALALAGTAIGLIAAICVILFEVSRGWWGVDSDRGIAGWVVTVAMFAAILFAEFRLLLAVFRGTGLKFNTKRLEPKPPLPWKNAVIVLSVAGVLAICAVVLFHQLVPILPFRSEVLLLAIGVSGGMLEFVDLKANRDYWLEKLKQANAETGQPQP